MKYEILNGEAVINTIMASAEFMAAQYPDGTWREVPEPPAPPLPETTPASMVQNLCSALRARGLTDADIAALWQAEVPA
jgi:hypothetical protein